MNSFLKTRDGDVVTVFKDGEVYDGEGNRRGDDKPRTCGHPGCENFTGLKRGENGMVRCNFHVHELEL